jgi:large subunit ribosomal protein L3
VTKPEAGHFASENLNADALTYRVFFTFSGAEFPQATASFNASFSKMSVTQVKGLENDGYQAIQVTTGAKKANRVTKPEAGDLQSILHLQRCGIPTGHGQLQRQL